MRFADDDEHGMPHELRIDAIAGVATIQDGGRRGHMHDGVPPGGALIPELLAVSNLALGNAWDAPAIELHGRLSLTCPAGTARMSVDGRTMQVDAGRPCTIHSSNSHRVSYVALPGGIDVPLVWGGRGTLLVAAIGGHEGRPLQRGDVIRTSAHSQATEEVLEWSVDRDAAIRVLPGPDLDRFAAEAMGRLVSESFVVSPRSDRMGTRLSGAPLARIDEDDGLSAPMVRGAIQVPRSGEPIVLGPDHPTTGGYPVLAVVIAADLGALLLRRPGEPVRFSEVTLQEATDLWSTAQERFHRAKDQLNA